MVRWLVIGGVAVLALTIYALVDLFVTAGNRLRAFPKPVWVAVIIVLPLIGPALWLFIGKNRPAVQGPAAPDDDPRFMGTLNESAEERIRRFEEELRALDDEDGVTPGETTQDPQGAKKPDGAGSQDGAASEYRVYDDKADDDKADNGKSGNDKTRGNTGRGKKGRDNNGPDGTSDSPPDDPPGDNTPPTPPRV